MGIMDMFQSICICQVAYDDFVAARSFAAAREKGLVSCFLVFDY